MITKKELYGMGYNPGIIEVHARAILTEALEEEMDEVYILEKVHAIERFIKEVTFSEATIMAIREREEERQRKIKEEAEG